MCGQYKWKTAMIVMAILIAFSSVKVGATGKILVTTEDVVTDLGAEIIVPIKISNNTGICGGTLSFSYSESLSLKKINRGTALPGLTMTVAGDLSANPVKISFDGIEEDTTDGIIAYLVFEPATSNGTYDVSVDGEVVNGSPQSVDIETKDGQIIVKESDEGSMPQVSVGNVVVDCGQNVEVPMYLSENPGICGMTLEVTYDTSLTLLHIKNGEALSSLTMTEPGDLLSNPIRVMFDGVEQDTSNGVFAILTFLAPQTEGIYNINICYNEGDIVNGDLKALDVRSKNGSVTVGKKTVEIIIGSKTVYMPFFENTDATIMVAFYGAGKELLSFRDFDSSETKICVEPDLSAESASIFCWSRYLRPLCTFHEIIY